MERRHIYGGAIAVTGIILTGVQIAQGLQQSTRPIVFAFESAPFVLVALALAFIGGWIARQEEFESELPIVVGWGVGGTILFASLGALLLFSQQVTLGTLEQAQYVAMNQVTVGAVVGTLVGIYDARNRLSMHELEQERDRVESFANKAADINNYGRELSQFESIDEVSALCIQAMQALLGLTEIAVVVSADNQHELVDDTVINVEDETLFEIADQTREQEESAVNIRDSPPALRRSEDVVTVLVTDHEDSSVAIVALTGDTTEFGEEDMELLEQLMRHASMTLDQIHEAASQQAAGQ